MRTDECNLAYKWWCRHVWVLKRIWHRLLMQKRTFREIVSSAYSGENALVYPKIRRRVIWYMDNNWLCGWRQQVYSKLRNAFINLHCLISQKTDLKFWVCVCSLWYPARKTNAPYSIAIGGLSGCVMFFFPNYLINGTIFGKKVIECKIYVRFFANFFRNISHSKKNSVRCYHKFT